jgi:hypothetical protein
MQYFVLEIFIPSAPQTVNRLVIEHPRLAGFIHNREGNVMMSRIILNRFMGGEPILDKRPSFRVINAAIFHHGFCWAHGTPPCEKVDRIEKEPAMISMP